jgi:hypothetical protein
MQIHLISGTSTANWASVGMAGGALLVALVLGLSNRRTARRALALSERQEARRESPIDIYLNTSSGWRRAAARDRLLGFHLVISNPSDRPTSIVSAELHLTYSTGQVLTTVKVPPLASLAQDAPAPDVDPVALPLRLDANDSVSGWFVFQLQDELVASRSIEGYAVVLRDVHRIEVAVQATVFLEAEL